MRSQEKKEDIILLVALLALATIALSIFAYVLTVVL